MMIPKAPRGWSILDSEKVKELAERKAQKEFEEFVKAQLREIDADAMTYLFVGWTEDYFVVRKGSQRGEHLTKFKRQTEFKLDNAKENRIRDYIAHQKDNARLRASAADEFERMKVLVEPVLETFRADDLKIELVTSRIIEIHCGETGIYGLEPEASLRLESSGEISEPTAYYRPRIYTISEARKFIDEFQRVSDQLTATAHAIKQALPSEFFRGE